MFGPAVVLPTGTVELVPAEVSLPVEARNLQHGDDVAFMVRTFAILIVVYSDFEMQRQVRYRTLTEIEPELVDRVVRAHYLRTREMALGGTLSSPPVPRLARTLFFTCSSCWRADAARPVNGRTKLSRGPFATRKVRTFKFGFIARSRI